MLHNHFGLELTWHDPLEPCRSPDFYQPMTDRLKGWAKRRGLKKGRPRASKDVDYTLEIQSPIFNNISDIHAYYDYCWGIARSVGIKSVSSRTWCSGGGHLHVGLGNSYGLVDTLQLAYNKASYLGDVFLEPTDKENFPVRCNWGQFGDHPELRFFEMPRNWAEQKAHILFADRWVQSAKKKSLGDFYSSPRRLKFNQARETFGELLAELNLNPKNYAVFIDRNLRQKLRN